MPRSTDSLARLAPVVRWLDDHAHRRAVRAAGRLGAVGFLALTLGYGLLAGQHLDDADGDGVGARLAEQIGYSAQQIDIRGLEQQAPEAVLAAIGVKPGGSLVGFDAKHARRLLESIDWVQSASVRMIHPNRLEIEVTEREPFALWQLEGTFYVIDRTGAAMSSLDPGRFADLFLVTGAGAQAAASDLVNHLEAWPALKSKVVAAARVGDRRWTLHLDGGRRVLLPETGVGEALARLMALAAGTGLFSSGAASIDLRVDGVMVVTPLPAPAPEKKAGKVALRP